MSKSKKPGKNYLRRLRNIGIIAHIDAGKTTLSERILFFSGKIHRMGEVHEGTATMDFMPEEQERGITIASACTTCEWNKNSINIIDTPGHVDFTIEVERALRVLDGAVGVFCGVAGVEPQSETVWRQSERYGVPKLAFVNKLDRIGANFSRVLDSMRERLGAKVLPLYCPDGEGQELAGIFDLMLQEHLSFDPSGDDDEVKRREMTEEEQDRTAEWRELFFETLAEEDDEFLELYLSGDDVPVEEMKKAVRRATVSMKLVPVFCGSALKNTGVQPLLDGICEYLPSPDDVDAVTGVDVKDGERVSLPADPGGPLAALAFKVSMETGRKLVLIRIYSGQLSQGEIVYNATTGKEERIARLFHLHAGRKEKCETAFAGDIVAAAGLKLARTGDTLAEKDRPVLLESIGQYKTVISMALEPKNSEESDRLEFALGHYVQEDPTLTVERDEDTDQLIISGMGELHLEVILERLKREYSLEPRSGKPQVVHQETIGSTALGEAVFDRELGEVRHTGVVKVTVEPLERNKGTDIVLEIDPDTYGKGIVDAVHGGIQDGLQSGVLKGYPVVDCRVLITGIDGIDGAMTDVGCRLAAAMALKDALAQAGSLLLEPLMELEITVPEDFVGDVISLLGTKGAKVDNMFDRAGMKVVLAHASLRKLFGFTTDLRSATQGRAGMMMQFSRFDVLD